MQEVWKALNSKTLRDYHEIYLKSDVLLLTDVFKNFGDLRLENYGLDPCWCLTAPNLTWDVVLKKTEVELELLPDLDV